jgi:hypothetical protein
MANHQPQPNEWRDPKQYFDSAMPGSVLYEAETKLPLTFVGRDKQATHPAVRSFYLQHAEWALYGKDVPPQKAQYYHELAMRREMYGDLARRRGVPYFGPYAPVIAPTLRPEGAKPLGPASDN